MESITRFLYTSRKAYKSDDFKDEDYINTNLLCEEVISLPMHSELTDDQIDFISDKVIKFLS